MSVSPLFPKRKLRLCYWNAETRVLDKERMVLERRLTQLGELEGFVLPSLDSPDFFPCDLLIVYAQTVPSADFRSWFEGFKKRMKKQGTIWTPALILSDVPFEELKEMLGEAVRDNWYFDILAPAHMDSLPIRVANLLRMHDHLHELTRYGAVLDDLNKRVAELEQELARMSPNKKNS